MISYLQLGQEPAFPFAFCTSIHFSIHLQSRYNHITVSAQHIYIQFNRFKDSTFYQRGDHTSNWLNSDYLQLSILPNIWNTQCSRLQCNLNRLPFAFSQILHLNLLPMNWFLTWRESKKVVVRSNLSHIIVQLIFTPWRLNLILYKYHLNRLRICFCLLRCRYENMKYWTHYLRGEESSQSSKCDLSEWSSSLKIH